jgi:S-adenosylmethionine decarboxylase
LTIMQLSIIAATLEGCPFAPLDDADFIGRLLEGAVAAGKLTMLHRYTHEFSPQGVTATAVLSESHINVHTWPERGLLFIDIATCSTEEATRAAFDWICAQVPHATVQRRAWLITEHSERQSAPAVDEQPHP